MRVLLKTGHINYETFAENLYKVHPIGGGEVYDISTPEKEKIVKSKFVRESLKEDLISEDDFKPEYFVEVPKKPNEPQFSLSQFKDADYVAKQTKRYEEAFSQYDAITSRNSSMTSMNEATTSRCSTSSTLSTRPPEEAHHGAHLPD